MPYPDAPRFGWVFLQSYRVAVSSPEEGDGVRRCHTELAGRRLVTHCGELPEPDPAALVVDVSQQGLVDLNHGERLIREQLQGLRWLGLTFAFLLAVDRCVPVQQSPGLVDHTNALRFRGAQPDERQPRGGTAWSAKLFQGRPRFQR